MSDLGPIQRDRLRIRLIEDSEVSLSELADAYATGDLERARRACSDLQAIAAALGGVL